MLFDLGEPVTAVARDGAFATRRGGEVVVRDATSRPLYAVPLDARIASQGLACEGRVFAASTDSGILLWSADGELEPVDVGPTLRALHERAGDPFASDRSWGPPVFTDNDLLITHHEHAIIVTAAGGESRIVASPELTLARCTWLLDDELAAIACSRNAPNVANATLFIASLVKGDILTRALPHAGMPLGAVRFDYQLLTIDERSLHVFDIRNGAELERHALPDSPCCLAALGADTVAVGTHAGTIWTFQRGEQPVARAALGERCYVHLRAEGDRIVALDIDGRAFAIARDDRAPVEPGAVRRFAVDPRGTAQALFALARGDFDRCARLLAWVKPESTPRARILRALAKGEGSGADIGDVFELVDDLIDLDSYPIAYLTWLDAAQRDRSARTGEVGIRLVEAVRYAEGEEETLERVRSALAEWFPDLALPSDD